MAGRTVGFTGILLRIPVPLGLCSIKGCNETLQLEYVHFDLAVISSMNYNIFDYGTFGMWGAYLSQAEITIGADLRVTDDDLRKFHLKDKLVDAGVEGFMFLQPP